MVVVRIHPLMHVPVPWIFALAYLSGVATQHFAPIVLHSANARQIAYVGGLIVTTSGALLAISGLFIFRAAGTTTVPYETASKLVTWGPYRFTRNPMYIGLVSIYIGVAGTQAQIWPVCFLPLVVAYLQWVVIPVEESRLRNAFGDEYQQYCARVRRWI